MDIALFLGRLILAGVFGLAGVTKLIDRAGSRKSFTAFGVPASLAAPMAVLLPVWELTCAVALLVPRTARPAAAAVLATLLIFIIAIVVNLLRGRTPDCHCFGETGSRPIGWATVLRNVVLSLVALAVWRVPAFASTGLDGASAMTFMPLSILSWISLLVAGLSLYLVVQVLRQNGRLLIRLEALESRTAGSDAPAVAGLPVESRAPGFGLPDLDGANVTLESLASPGKSLILIFVEPRCSACDAVLPDVARWQRDEAGRMQVMVISRGTSGQNRNKRAKFEIQQMLVQQNREVAESYQVTATPSAVLIVEGKIASPLAVGPDAIRQLVTRTLVPRVGDPAPRLELQDLDGGLVKLPGVTEGRTLLLFWNPSCGFCQEMLPDLTAWEKRRPAGAPRLVVISSGTAAANREQGFQSPVLLDPEFAAGTAFGATGTPSALLLEPDGTVASSVQVGSAAVLSLTRPS